MKLYPSIIFLAKGGLAMYERNKIQQVQFISSLVVCVRLVAFGIFREGLKR